MSTNVRKTVQLGDVVVTAFDWAAQYSSDPRELPLLATKAVECLLQRALKTAPTNLVASLSALGNIEELPALDAAGCRPSALASRLG
jgi:hypothetical protein